MTKCQKFIRKMYGKRGGGLKKSRFTWWPVVG